MNRHVLAPIGTALECVADERLEVEAERDAFTAFAAGVDACPARSGPSVTALDPAASVRTTGPGADAQSALDDVVTAIRRHPADHPDDAPSLAELERPCDRVGTERQRVVQRQRRFSRERDALYGDQSWTYPVLWAVATLGEDLSTMRDGVSDGAR